ncbi:acid protease [Trametes sanguinea]|nr:acid protease [Trametes sanguinea]
MLAGLRIAPVLLCVLALGFSQPGESLVVRNASPVTLPIARRLNVTGAANLVRLDQARAKAFKSRSKTAAGKVQRADIFNTPITNEAVDYVASVGVGNPPTEYSLLIDTGSSNTWVGAGKAFARTNTTKDTGNLVEVTYGSGFVFGTSRVEFTDQVTLAPGLVIQDQSIGAAIESQGFDGVDGIIGIGPVDLTCGTLIPALTDCIPTVTDNAFTQGLIPAHEIGISFAPTQSLEATNGELTFGGIDESKFTGPLNFVPITSTSPANEFLGIDQSVTYGPDGTVVLAATSGITDTGTTLLLLASDAFATYQSLTGGVLDNDTGLLKLNQTQFANLQSLFFHIGDTTYEFTPNAQLWPRALNTAIGGQADAIYLIVSDLGSLSGEGLDFINGMTFLERFYYVFDIANSRVGFATTKFTDATTN